MPAKIKVLTESQKARFKEWTDKWISTGLSTERADREKFERNAKACYRLAGLKGDHLPVIWVPSPVVGALAAPIAAQIIAALRALKEGKPVFSAVDSAVRSAVFSEVFSEVDSAVDSAVDPAVRSAVRSAVGSAVFSEVDSAVDSAVDPAVRSAVGSAVFSEVDSAVGSAVRSAVGSAVFSEVGSAVGSASKIKFWHYWMGGQMWSGWIAYTTFFVDVCGWEPSGDMVERINAYAATCESACYWWPNKDFIMVSDRPTAIKRDERGRLHAEDGMAISWPDGWGLWMWHGARVTEKIIMRPQEIMREEIMQESNSEVSRAIAERLGWDEYMKRADTVLVGKWFDPSTSLHYELYELKKRFEMTPRLLKMESPEVIDGSRPHYIEPVHPGLETCQAARKWQFMVLDCDKCKITVPATQIRHGDVQIITYTACPKCGTPGIARWPEVAECNKSPELDFEVEA